MRKYAIAISALAAAVLSPACREDVLSGQMQGQKVSLTATIETPSSTKVSLGEETQTGSFPVLWSEGDKIMAYSSEASAEFTLSSGAGTRNAVFDGDLKGTPAKAIFPSSAAGQGQDEIILPVNQTYVRDNVAPGAVPMVAEISDYSISFRNLCGILRLQLTSEEPVTVKCITVWNGDRVEDSEPMAGRASVTYGDEPSLSFDSRAPRYVRLDCSAHEGGGVQVGDEAVAFHIVIPPTTTEFFSIEVETADGRIAFKRTRADSRNVIRRSELKIMPQTALEGFEDKYARGTFILNEGNMSDETGTLTYISPFGTVTDSCYFKANGFLLGNVAQDMYFTGGKMYVICQNGSNNGGRGILSVSDARTLVNEKIYEADALPGISWPTHVAVVSGLAYIRDNNGVYTLDLSTDEFKFVEGSKGAAKNRMAVAGGKVFVPAGAKIFVMQDGALVHTITDLPGTVSGVIRTDDGNLFVSCTSSPASILKISSSDYSVIRRNDITEAKVGAGWGATPGISAKGDRIYFSNAGTVIYRHDFSTGETVQVGDVKSFVEFPGVVYNNLGVHPQTEEVFFNTIKGYGMSYKTNDIAVFDFTGSDPVFRYDFQEHNSFPAGVFFPQYYE